MSGDGRQFNRINDDIIELLYKYIQSCITIPKKYGLLETRYLYVIVETFVFIARLIKLAFILRHTENTNKLRTNMMQRDFPIRQHVADAILYSANRKLWMIFDA